MQAPALCAPRQANWWQACTRQAIAPGHHGCSHYACSRRPLGRTRRQGDSGLSQRNRACATDDADFWLAPANAARHPRHAHAFAQARLDLAPCLTSGKLHRVAGAGEIVPGIRTRPAAGHTPGNSSYWVGSEGQKRVLLDGLIHGKDAHFRRPGIAISFDVGDAAAVRQRTAAMADTASKGYMVGAAHISFPDIGRITARHGSYCWLSVNYSEAALRRKGVEP